MAKEVHKLLMPEAKFHIRALEGTEGFYEIIIEFSEGKQWEECSSRQMQM